MKKKELKDKSIPEVHFSKSKIEKMKLIAQRLSRKLVQQASATKTVDENVDSDKTTFQPQPSTSATQQLETLQDKSIPEKISELEDQPIKKTNSELNESKVLKKKKNKLKKHLFEGEYVPYLVKSKTAKRKEKKESEVKTEDDEYVLKKLFTKSGKFKRLIHIQHCYFQKI